MSKTRFTGAAPIADGAIHIIMICDRDAAPWTM
jgi:hypothetical protein